tara:strand:+ start:897 stop:2225 length:1329 start_codon:yes stop_codon:yes gene_type:complete
MYISENPFTQQHLADFECTTTTQCMQLLTNLSTTFETYKHSTVDQRLAIISHCATQLEQHKHDLAQHICTEMGKPITQALGEIEKAIGLCHYYATQLPSYFNQLNSTNHIIQPLGIILAVMPWNFPVWQLFRVLIPQLAVGNVVLCKPAPNMNYLHNLLADSLQDIPMIDFARLSNKQVANCINDSRIAGVTLTGSVRAGKAVGALAAGVVKPTVLELGGSDPFIVCADANLDLACDKLMLSRFLNAGQSCIAAKRLLLHADIKDTFLAKLSTALHTLTPGDPLDVSTTLGPVAKKSCLEQLSKQVNTGLSQQATITDQLALNQPTGYFYPPTIIELTDSANTLWSQEVFGPILPYLTFYTDSDALTLANQTTFGLGASIWSNCTTRQQLFTHQLNAGMVAVNDMMVSSYDRPFGGIKQSGYGKELALEGLLSFANYKQIVV